LDSKAPKDTEKVKEDRMNNRGIFFSSIKKKKTVIENRTN
jgi:hypothetical protein